MPAGYLGRGSRQARERHPNRWSGDIRDWELPEKVWSNLEKEQTELNKTA